MLERMAMSAEIEVNIVLSQDWINLVYHIFVVAVSQTVVGINVVMTNDNSPFLMRGSQRTVQPFHLTFLVLGIHVGIFFRIVMRTLHQWCRVNKDKAYGGLLVQLKHLCVVTFLSFPAPALMGIVQYGLCVSIILVVAQSGIPITHQVGMCVGILKITLPQGVVDTLHSCAMKGVATVNNERGHYNLRKLAHYVAHFSLLVKAISSQVRNPEET